MAGSDGMLKIFFEPTGNPGEDWHDHTESLWATPADESSAPGGRIFRLENSPWYAFGVSYLDDVCAEPRTDTFPEDSGEVSYTNLYFTEVWKHNGHSTYTVYLLDGRSVESADWLAFWCQLKPLGCSYEGMNGKLLAMDVEPENDLDAIETILSEAEATGCIEFQVQHRFVEGNTPS